MFGEVMEAKKAMSSEQLADLAAIEPKRAKRFTCIQRLCHIEWNSSCMAILMAGDCHVLIPKFDARSVFDAIQEQGATSFITVPGIMPDLLLFYARLWEDRTKVLNGGDGLSLDLINGASQLFPYAAIFLAYGPHFFDDMVDMMEDKIAESFNADLDHNSVLDVADQLLFIHEQCLQSNYSPIEKLKNSHVEGNDVSRSRQIVADDSDISNDNDDTSMMNDEVAAVEEMAVGSNPTSDADGWTVPRRRGRRAN